MSRALLQTANTSTQTVVVNSIISPGNVVRRYGCNIRLNGNAQEVSGEGYYKLTGSVSVAPTAAGTVTVALYENGVLIPGTQTSSSVTTAGSPTTLPLVGTIRQGCCCDGASQITCVLLAGPGNVTNYSLRIEKD